ncbi:hypothetical protein HNY73_021188 [Argiope bruennichi]|uniref:Uncharacterized protein n=1 Tax=Argiope bruennichi TaxID=94029 RepID=A0A8T0EA73_ARGBR|nr:hypothetical protein HNY73_021188 [Argiope bruennichi]
MVEVFKKSKMYISHSRFQLNNSNNILIYKPKVLSNVIWINEPVLRIIFFFALNQKEYRDTEKCSNLFISADRTAGSSGQIALEHRARNKGSSASQRVGDVIQYPSAVFWQEKTHTIHIMPKSSICSLKGPNVPIPRQRQPEKAQPRK